MSVTKNKNDLVIVTSALPYINNIPHLGNIIGSTLSADVYSRYCKLVSQPCIYICGTDEYGTATEMKAIEMGIHPKEICKINSKRHKDIYDWFDINFDFFGRTSESKTHIATVHDIFNKLYDNGFFEEIESQQYYCENCNLFLADRYVIGECIKCESKKARGDQCDDCGTLLRGNELKNANCSLCTAIPVHKKTKHLYIKLDSLKNEIKQFYEQNKETWSQNARDITEQWLNIELHSRCMTRDLKHKWGVPIPKDGYDGKVFYVWFDAPIGYFSFLKEVLQEKYESTIRSNKIKLVQFMGKDNVTFHSIIFPAMLLGTRDNYHLVDTISSTEYLMFENDKFSKSRGIGIFGNDLIDNSLGKSCYWRFYLIKIRPENKDTNFSYNDFKTTVSADLINNIGNFINRTLKFVKNKLNGTLKISKSKIDSKFIEKITILNEKYKKNMEACELKKALKNVLEISSTANEYLQSAFNESNKKDIEYKNTTFSIAVSVVFLLMNLIKPLMPKSSEKLSKMIEVKSDYNNDFVILEQDEVVLNEIVPLFEPFTAEMEEKLQYKNL